MLLVLHADDLGMNRAVTDGIVRGFREGLLTSTSLLANAPDAVRALSQWKDLLAQQAAGPLPSADARKSLDDPNAPFDLGVHLNLTQGRPLGDCYPRELLDREGRFPGIFPLFARLLQSRGRFREAIRDQWRRQIQLVVDHGLRPTHLNGHQYVEMLPGMAKVVFELMEQFGIRHVRAACEPALFQNTVLNGFHVEKWPLAVVKHWFAAKFRKKIDTHGIARPDAYFGVAHAGGVDLPLLRRFLASGQSHRSVEIALHPGEEAGATTTQDWLDGWFDPLADARPAELRMLVSDELPELLKSSGRRLGRLATI